MKYFSLLPWPPPPSQKWNSVQLLASFYDGKHKHEAIFLKKWNSDHEIAYPLPPSEKYFTSLASRYFLDGPLDCDRMVGGGWGRGAAGSSWGWRGAAGSSWDTQVQVDSLFLALLGPVMDSRPDKNLQAPDAVPDEAIRQTTSITFS